MQEEQRAELSAELEPHTNEIQQNVQILGHFDFVNASAVSNPPDAIQPTVSVENHISLRQAASTAG